MRVSLRTLYRDIATLKGQGADIAGEPGLGYVLQPGFMLPPLMFSPEEIEALVLGARWVATRGDKGLRQAAGNVLAKVVAVLPEDLKDGVEQTTLLIGPTPALAAGPDLGLLREAIRSERKLSIAYADGQGAASSRIIWPFALAFFEGTRVVVAWCELRRDHRHFRTDRMSAVKLCDSRYPRRRPVLLKEWREREGIPPSPL